MPIRARVRTRSRKPGAGPVMKPAGGGFRVLVATDGSAQARAAVAMADRFPWPSGTHLSAIVGRGMVPAGLPRSSGGALEAALAQVAEQTRQSLAARWPRVKVSVVDGVPAQAIVAESGRCRARVIVLGTRGHGAVARLLLGSVSRSVATTAPCSVLVVRGDRDRIDQIVVGVDGSAQSRRAVDLVARLAPARGRRVTVVRALEPVRIPSLGLLPAGVRSMLTQEAAALQARNLRAAEQDVRAATSRLTHAGWRASGTVRIGAPAQELLRVQAELGADLLVVGARGVGGVERLLLGSVADTVLAQSPVSVLVAR